MITTSTSGSIVGFFFESRSEWYFAYGDKRIAVENPPIVQKLLIADWPRELAARSGVRL